jgi:hypothetical protein
MSVVATLVAGVVTGCNGHPSARGPADSPTPPSTSAPPESHHHIEVKVVRSIDIGPDDLPRPYQSKNTFGGRYGNFVIGQVTMDLCGADFFSEIFRTARHQVGYSAPNKDYVSTETVSYRDSGAARAMRELRHAIRTCPTGYVHSTVAGVPPMKQEIERIPRASTWLPDTVAFALTNTVKGRPSEHGVLVYQHQGNLITAAYVYAGAASSRVGSQVASLLAKRLKVATDSAGSAS